MLPPEKTRETEAKHDQRSFITFAALTLHGHLDDQECTLDKDDHAPRLGDGEHGGKHAEHPVDVRPSDSDGGEEGVQVVGYVEGMGKFLDLDECSKGRDDAEGEDDDLRSRVDPEHLPLVFRTVFHDKEDDEDDDAANEAEQSKEESLAGALAIHPKVSSPLLSTWLLQKSSVKTRLLEGPIWIRPHQSSFPPSS